MTSIRVRSYIRNQEKVIGEHVAVLVQVHRVSFDGSTDCLGNLGERLALRS